MVVRVTNEPKFLPQNMPRTVVWGMEKVPIESLRNSVFVLMEAMLPTIRCQPVLEAIVLVEEGVVVLVEGVLEELVLEVFIR